MAWEGTYVGSYIHEASDQVDYNAGDATTTHFPDDLVRFLGFHTESFYLDLDGGVSAEEVIDVPCVPEDARISAG